MFWDDAILLIHIQCTYPTINENDKIRIENQNDVERAGIFLAILHHASARSDCQIGKSQDDYVYIIYLL